MISACSKRVIIVGHKGQDGSLLIRNLRKRGDSIIGIGREDCISPDDFLVQNLLDITDSQQIYSLVSRFQPDEVYYLAACHTSSELFDEGRQLCDQFHAAQNVHVTGLVNFLSAIADQSQKTRLFYAASSLVFSGEDGIEQDESTAFSPQEFYGITKAQGLFVCRTFREKYGVFASTGILYNHESNLRKPSFLTAKIIKTAIRIANGSPEKLEIGDLSRRVDWGYAKDFVLAFEKILLTDKPDDYIVATGESHSVGEFVRLVFDYFNLNPIEYIIEGNKKFLRAPQEKIGNIGKLSRITGWKPTYSFENFVKKLISDHVDGDGHNFN